MRKILFTGLILAFASLFVVGVSSVVLADTVDNNEAPVAIVEEITTADLGVENPGLLPTNPFYFFKEWSRGIRMFFTFNGVSKVEYELKIANQKAAELKKVQEAKPDDTEAIKEALDNYNENVEKLKGRLQSLGETSENPNIDKLLDKLAERAMKHQQLFEELKDKHEELHEEIDDVEDEIDEVMRHAVEDIDKPEKAGERLEKAIEAQKEGQTKELKAIKFLSNLEEDVDSPELIEKLAQVKTRQVKKIEIKLGEGSIDLLQIEGLIDKLTADQLQRLKIVIELKERVEGKEFKIKLGELEDDALEEAEDKKVDFINRASEMISMAGKMIRELESEIAEESGEALREQACSGEVAPACGVPKIPVCRDGKWTCIGPAEPGGTMVGLSNIDKLLDEAKHHLDLAKKAYEEKKYGEAFGHANSAYVIVKAALGKLEQVEESDEDDKIFCVEVYDPICGSDNRTYYNECKAKVSGAKIQYKGECTAKEEPKACIQLYDPVCGADGKTYSNTCFAGLAHVDVKYKGACGKPESENSDSLKFEADSQIKISPDFIKIETEDGTAITVSRVWNVGIGDEGFYPAELKIRKGDTVVWTNKGSKSSWPASAMHPTHDVYPEKGGCIGSTFDACKGLGFGETFKFVFNQAGFWKYHDHLNTTHFGAVIVE